MGFPKQPQNRLLGYLYALGATVVWSGNFIVARGLHESMPPVSLAFWRWVVAVIVFLPFALKALIAEWHILRRHLPYLAITSLLGITTFNTLIYFAGHSTTAINLSLISITFPVIIVILVRIVYQEPITAGKAAGILLVVAGVVLLVSGGRPAMLLHLTFAVGDVWMLIAAIVFAVYSILLKRKPKSLSIRAFQLSCFILGTVFLLPFFLWEVATVSSFQVDVNIVTAILYLGIGAAVVSFVLWNKAILIIGPSKAGMVYYTLPLFSALLAYFLLGEAFTVVHGVSGVLIVSGIVVASYPFSKR